MLGYSLIAFIVLLIVCRIFYNNFTTMSKERKKLSDAVHAEAETEAKDE